MKKGREKDFYVMSDIHGRYEAFIEMMDIIKSESTDYEVMILGDVIDRGDSGVKILDFTRHCNNIQLLMGNHERMMLKSLNNPDICKKLLEVGHAKLRDILEGIYTRHGCLPVKTEDMELAENEAFWFLVWYRNKGYTTLEELEKRDYKQIRRILDYLKKLSYEEKVMVNGETYCLVHSMPYELIAKEVTDADIMKERMVWDEMTRFTRLDDMTIVFGHRCTSHYQGGVPYKIFKEPGLIGIDCGCALVDKNRRLGCLRLNDMKEFYVPLVREREQ